MRETEGGPCIPEDKCPTGEPAFNCNTREVWTLEKKTWCCENEKKGCEPECGANEVKKECGTACQKHCKSPKIQMCTMECKIDQCECQDGFVRETPGGSCIPEDQCPKDNVCDGEEDNAKNPQWVKRCAKVNEKKCKKKGFIRNCAASCCELAAGL